MSIYEFLERLEADPFDPELTALFLGKPQKAETEPAERLAEIKVDEAQIEAMLKNLFPVKDNASDCVKRNAQANKDSFLMCYAAPDIAKFYGTAWGAINAAADMVAHTAPNRMTAGYAENSWNRIMSGHQLVDAVTAAVSH